MQNSVLYDKKLPDHDGGRGQPIDHMPRATPAVPNRKLSSTMTLIGLTARCTHEYSLAFDRNPSHDNEICRRRGDLSRVRLRREQYLLIAYLPQLA